MSFSIRLLALSLMVAAAGCNGVDFAWDQYNPNLDSGMESSVNSFQWTPDGYRTTR